MFRKAKQIDLLFFNIAWNIFLPLNVIPGTYNHWKKSFFLVCISYKGCQQLFFFPFSITHFPLHFGIFLSFSKFQDFCSIRAFLYGFFQQFPAFCSCDILIFKFMWYLIPATFCLKVEKKIILTFTIFSSCNSFFL